jgi:hypothetical protein
MNQESKKSRSNDDNSNNNRNEQQENSSSSSSTTAAPIPSNLNPMTTMMEQMASLANIPGFSDVMKMQQEMMAKMMSSGGVSMSDNSIRGRGGRGGFRGRGSETYVPRGRSAARAASYRGRGGRGRGGYIPGVAPFAKDTAIEEQKVSVDMVMSERPKPASKIVISNSEPLGVNAYDEEFNKDYVYATRGRGGSRGGSSTGRGYGSSTGRGRGRFSSRGRGGGRFPIVSGNV